MKNLWFLLVFQIFVLGVFAQDSSDYKINYRFDLEFGANTKRVQFTALLPVDILNKQKILSISYSIDPICIFKDGDNTYAQFEFLNPQGKKTLMISTATRILRNDLSLALKKHIPFERDSLNEFLTPEKFVESDNPFIVNKALSFENKDTLKVVRRIFDYVNSNIMYSGYMPESKGALLALTEGKGDCSEYADAFVALCRASGIPARVICGITVNSSSTPYHNWAEVFIDKHGWVAFDPTPGNGATFKTLQNRYVYLSNIRNDNNLRSGYFYSYRYWGDKIDVNKSLDIGLISNGRE